MVLENLSFFKAGFSKLSKLASSELSGQVSG
jgi:hypothetical protein